MAKGPLVTPELIHRVKELKDKHHGWFLHEIAKYVDASDTTISRILRDEYAIEDGIVIRKYKESKKTEEKMEKKPDPNPEQNMSVPGYDYTKQMLNMLYGSKSFKATLNDIYDELKQIREALTDIRNMLKYSFKG